MRQRLKEKLRIEYLKRLGEMETIFKIWRSLFRSKAAECALIKFWEMLKIVSQMSPFPLLLNFTGSNG